MKLRSLNLLLGAAIGANCILLTTGGVDYDGPLRLKTLWILVAGSAQVMLLFAGLLFVAGFFFTWATGYQRLLAQYETSAASVRGATQRLDVTQWRLRNGVWKGPLLWLHPKGLVFAPRPTIFVYEWLSPPAIIPWGRLTWSAPLEDHYSNSAGPSQPSVERVDGPVWLYVPDAKVTLAPLLGIDDQRDLIRSLLAHNVMRIPANQPDVMAHVAD